MADFLANQVMDSRFSAQDRFPTMNDQLRGVTEWLAYDFEQWAQTWKDTE